MVPLISPGPTIPVTQNVVNALPTSSCDVVCGAVVQRATAAITGPFSDWVGSNTDVYNVGGGWVKCVTGNTTIKATKTKMEFDKYGKKIMKDGASNYWRLNEVSGLIARDIVGGANGTISGGVTLNQAGATKDNDKAMTFDGTTGQIVTGSTVTIPASLTMEVWVKGGGIGAQQPLVNTTYAASRASVFILLMPPGTARFFWFNAAGNTITGDLVDTTLVMNGQWHHVVAVANGVTMQIYVDGVIKSQTTASAGFASVAAVPIEIAKDSSNPFFYLGSLDEVAIYPYALSANQISAHYTAGKR